MRRPRISRPALQLQPRQAAPIGSKAAGAAFKDTWTYSDLDVAALDFHLGQPKEIALIGDLNSDATQDLLDEIHLRYLPNRVLAQSDHGDPAGSHPLPLLRHKTLVEGQPTVYVCRNYTCQLPVTTPKTLSPQLDTRTQ